METTVQKPETRPAEAPAPNGFKPKKKRKWLKVLLIVVVVLALIAAPFTLQHIAAGQVGGVGTYLADTAAVRELTVSVSGTGTVQPIDSYQVTTLLSGDILDAPFEEGDTVQEGDLLFRVDSKDVENSIARTELSVEQARLSYNDLLTNQKNTRLEANADGVIQTLYIEAGDTISTGAVVADILDRDTMSLTVPFHSADAATFYEGQPATVTVDGTLETLTGVVDKIYATDEVGPGGTLVRRVTINVTNPGAISDTTSGTAMVGSAACSSSANFAYAAQKQVVAKTSGEIAELYVSEGDRVSEGALLGTFTTDSISTQIENARLSLESAQLSLESARNQLEDYSITSPISGTVIEKNFKAGDTIDATTSGYLAVIYDMTALTFDMSINELDIGKIQVGQRVEITADALDGKTFTGYVDKININGTTANGKTTYPVTVILDGSGTDLQAQGLYPGMNISATIIVEEIGETLCIPVDYVTRGNTVLVALPGAMDDRGNVVNTDKIETREVTLGRNSDEYIEVLDGLEEGDTVLRLNQSSNIMSMMMGG